MHGWQSESIDGPKGGCDFWWLQWSLHPHLQDVVWCSEVQCNCSCSCSGSYSCSVLVVVAVAVVEVKCSLV